MCSVFWYHKLEYQRRVRWGSPTNYSVTLNTHLVQLIAQIYWVDIVAFQIREHDDLWAQRRRSVSQTASSSTNIAKGYKEGEQLT